MQDVFIKMAEAANKFILKNTKATKPPVAKGPGRRSVLSRSMQDQSKYMPGKCDGFGVSRLNKRKN